MRSDKRIHYFAGILLTALIAAAMFAALMIVCRTDYQPVLLADGVAGAEGGWTYEVRSDGKNIRVEPDFNTDSGIDFGVEHVSAVRMRRVLRESYSDAVLNFYPQGDTGIEIFLDEELLYTDFPGIPRDDAGYRMLERAGEEAWFLNQADTYVNLPPDYVGRTLTFVTYYTGEDVSREVAYPILENWLSESAGPMTGMVLPVLVMTVCGVISLVLCCIFLSGIRYNNVDYRICLLAVTFFVWFFYQIFNASLDYYSGMARYLDLSFLYIFFALPLTLYVATGLTSFRRWVMLAVCLLVYGYMGVQSYQFWRESGMILQGDTWPVAALFLVMAVLLIAEYRERREEWRRFFTPYYILAAAVCLAVNVALAAVEFGGRVDVYLENMLVAARYMNFHPLVTLIQTSAALFLFVLLVTEWVRNIRSLQYTAAALAARERTTLENYRLIEKSVEETRMLRHEMSHHLETVGSMLRESDPERAQEYIRTVTELFSRKLSIVYSKNALVNLLVGNYLERAKSEGIFVKCNINVPERLEIRDTDLCMLLTNLFENAVEACERMGDAEGRFVHVTIFKEKKRLFIDCTNSTAEETPPDAGRCRTGKADPDHHGYGLRIMNRIARRYDSVLNVQWSPGKISVSTSLFLKKEGGGEESWTDWEEDEG